MYKKMDEEDVGPIIVPCVKYAFVINMNVHAHSSITVWFLNMHFNLTLA